MSGFDQGRGSDLLDVHERARFEQLVLPHVDAAFNLARWLLRRREDAEDVAPGSLTSLVPFLPRLSWWRCARMAAPDRAQYLLHMAGEKSPHGAKHGIRRRVTPAD